MTHALPPSPSAATPTEAPLRFLFRGEPVTLYDVPPTRTLLQWLREDARACGTKEGCAEGDCGACTVLVAEWDEAEPGLAANRAVGAGPVRARPVNACIRFLPTLHGKAVLTVEDMGTPERPHPAQQALVAAHGSQCGFCTPGFVVSLAATHERHVCRGTRPTHAEVVDDLAGNLCRCTGYRPIVEAGLAMFDTPAPGTGLPLGALAVPLAALRQDPPLAWPGRFHAPRALADLAALRRARPEARLVAGATDVGLWVTKQFRELGEVIWLGDVAELRRLVPSSEGLWIGAAVPLEDAWAELARHWPSLSDMGRRFAGPPVRHAGTLVGNLANGSPIGDGPPVLMALGAQLCLRLGEQQRRLSLEDFYLDYMKNALQPGEFIEAVWVPLDTTGPGWTVQAHKLSKRHDCDISAVAAGFALQQVDGLVRAVRLAWGGMAATVRRASAAEAALLGRPWDAASLADAQQALQQDFTPLSDLRASAAYRRQAASAFLQRLAWACAPGGSAPAIEWDLRAAARTLTAHPAETPSRSLP